jgi:hypothetical protein
LTDLKPIETEYAGHRFRSRTGARWAVFLNELDLIYEYEPEGYKLSSSDQGLCDLENLERAAAISGGSK